MYLEEYQKIDDINELLASFNPTNFPHLCDDFNHVLIHHLGDKKSVLEIASEYERIYDHIRQRVSECDIEKCTIFQRNNRIRETQCIPLTQNKNRAEIEYYVETMDSMHCYFMHSFDVGFRIKQSDLNDVTSSTNEKNELPEDALVSKLSAIIQTKRKKIQKIRFQNTKYVTQQTVETADNEQKQEIVNQSGDQPQLDKINETLLQNGIDDQTFIKFNEWIKENEVDSDGIDEDVLDGKTHSNLFTFLSNIGASKYFHLIHEQKEEPEEIADDSDTTKEKAYSFGYRYSYWSKTKSNYVTQKYANLCDELLNNKIFAITKPLFKSIQKKGKKKFASNYAKSLVASRHVHEKSRDAVKLTLEHILSILFYTDCSTLSYHFSSTFRSLNESDTFKLCKKRNSEYWHFSKLLIETVNSFGTKMSSSKIKIFYHGISDLLLFSSFVTIFNSPTSTTTQFSVATVFAKENGAILELRKYHKNLRYFNCSWLSCYANEDVRLFVSPTHRLCQLRISSIRSIKEKQNYEYFIHALTTLNYIITPQQPQIGYSMRRRDRVILQKLFDDDEKCPFYPKLLFKKKAKATKEIKIELSKIYASCSSLKELFFDDFWILNVAEVCKVFCNCRKIEVDYHKYDGKPKFFTIGKTFLKNILIKLTKVNDLNRLMLTKVQCPSSVYKKFVSEFKQNGWELTRETANTSRASGGGYLLKNVTGAIIFTRLT